MKTNQYNEPDMIFLQLHDPDDEGKTELADPEADGVTWCWEQIHHNDVEYIRKDLYDELKNQITAYQLTIANMESEREGKVLVPIDPTDEMDREYTLKSGQSHLSVRGYKAMLSAGKGES